MNYCKRNYNKLEYLRRKMRAKQDANLTPEQRKEIYDSERAWNSVGIVGADVGWPQQLVTGIDAIAGKVYIN